MNKRLIVIIIGFVMASNFLTACEEQKLKNNVVYEVKEKTNDKLMVSINNQVVSEEEVSTEEIDDNKSAIDKFTEAVLCNDIEYVKKTIISDTIDINGKDSNEEYPIEIILIMENCEMAKILLEAGADPYVETSEGKSVYDIVMSNHSKYMKSIFEEYSKDKE